MSAIARLKRMVTLGPRTPTHAECRRCGTSVDTGIGPCPECGSEEIASYDF